MRSPERELKERFNEMGSEVTTIKFEAHLEKIAIIDAYTKREVWRSRTPWALVQSLEDKAHTSYQQVTALSHCRSNTSNSMASGVRCSVNFCSRAKGGALATRRLRISMGSKPQLEEHQQATLEESNELHDRIRSLKGQLSTKEKQKLEEILVIREETKDCEKELKDQVSDLGLKVTNVKLAAHQERMAIVEEYKAREQSLESEIDHLRDLLGREKESLVVNQEMTGRIVAQRVDSDAMVGELQREFDQGRNNGTTQYNNQQEAHRRDVESSRQDLEAMRQESLVEARRAQDRITSLQQQLSTKERQKQDALLAIKDEMKRRY